MRALDSASCTESHERFVSRVIAGERVWYLSGESGVATARSDDSDGTSVLLFWSDAAYAKRAKKETFPEFDVDSMDLFDFLFRWLLGMSGDGVLAGTNWTYDLIGIESSPLELREEIEKIMPKDLLENYHVRYEEVTGENK